MKPLSNIEIEKMLKGVSNFRGVFSKDMLPKEINKSESTVVNLQDFFAGPGTHWVAIFNAADSNDVEYFDSFGLVPANEIVAYMKTSRKNLIFNDSQIQNMDSIMCGWFCVYFIKERYNGKTPQEILMDFHDNPSRFNEMFMQFLSHIKDGNLLRS